MKKLTLTILLIPLALGLGACEKKKNSESINPPRCTRGNCAGGSGGTGGSGGDSTGGGSASSQYEPVDGTYWGQIHQGNYTQGNFYEGVQGFVSANINPYSNPPELGFVSGDINKDTGVWFWGHIETDGNFNPSKDQNLKIETSSGELRIVVWDSYAGKADANGDIVPEYPVHFKGAYSGRVSGKTAVIRFRDDYGWVELNGEFNEDYFQGYVEYENFQSWDGSAGAAGVMGYFFVPTCGFFVCN